jgi:HSP20 family protein
MRYLVNRPANLFGDFDRVLNNLFEENQSLGRRNPSVDIRADEKAYTLDVELPGMSEKDVELKVEDNKLYISSVKKESEKDNSVKNEEIHFLLKERKQSEFARSFILPKDVDPEAIEASFSKGVLTISISKVPEKQPRSIKIKAA